MDTNASGASVADASDDQIIAALDWRESKLFTPAEKVALELAEAMTETPALVTDDLFRRAEEHYSSAEIVELAAVIAFENFRSRFNRCGAVEPHGFYPKLDEILAAAGLAATVPVARP